MKLLPFSCSKSLLQGSTASLRLPLETWTPCQNHILMSRSKSTHDRSEPGLNLGLHSADCRESNCMRVNYQNPYSLPSSPNRPFKRTDPSSSLLKSLAWFGSVHQYEDAMQSHPSRVSVSELDSDCFRLPERAPLHGCPDGRAKCWIRRIIPVELWPYAKLARLEKPIGTWLVAWPCFWAVCLAAPSGRCPDLKILGCFGLWAILHRGAACTLNDVFDRDFDAKVERTRYRPIASGVLTRAQGLFFFACQLFLVNGVLLQLNALSRMLGAFSVVLSSIYPLMKRWTFWPQAFLGFAINWSILPGWAAVSGNLDLSIVLPVYASSVCWTLIYDTIYAHQDKKDDIKAGVRSTALLFGWSTKLWLTAFSILCFSGLTLAGLSCGLGWPFYAGMAAIAGHLAWQVSSVDLDDPADCNSKFVSNQWFGAIYCTAIVLGKLADSPA